MPTGKDPTRIYKSAISPRQPLKLGASATWSKLKYQTSTSFSQQLNSAASFNNNLINSVNGHQTSKYSQVTKIGPNGEIFVCYGNSVEVWDWIPSSLQLSQMDKEVAGGAKNKEEFEGLYLVAALSNFKEHGEIVDIEPVDVRRYSNSYDVVLTLKKGNETSFIIKNFGQLFEEDIIEKQLILPPSIHGSSPYLLKSSSKFVGISTNEGSLTIFDVHEASPLPFTIDVDIVNDRALFDIQGRILVYVPRDDPTARDEKPLTQLNVPVHNHSMYSRIFETLSTTALDGFSKLKDLKNNINDTDLKTSMAKYLSMLINGVKQTQRIVIFDLETQRELGSFKPPSGVSNLSLSPFNSHLLTITQRGDQLYKWDLTRLPIEINLIDIQTRGKTGSIVQDINWYSNDVFQIVTKRSGSIHCFHSEYNSKNWILPNLRVKQIGKINGGKNELVGLNEESNEIYIVDLKGFSNFKYQLPKSSIPRSLLPNYIPLDPISEIEYRQNPRVKPSPLAQIELETCLLGPSLAMHDKFQFATFDFDKDLEDRVIEDDDGNDNDTRSDETIDDTTKFWRLYKVFGNDIPVKKLDLGRGDGTPVFHGEKDDLTEAIEGVLIYNDEGV